MGRYVCEGCGRDIDYFYGRGVATVTAVYYPDEDALEDWEYDNEEIDTYECPECGCEYTRSGAMNCLVEDDDDDDYDDYDDDDDDDVEEDNTWGGLL